MTLIPNVAGLLPRLVLITLLAFGFGVLLLRRRLWNVFDPLLLLLLYLALNVAAVVGTAWDVQPADAAYVMLGYLLLLIGILLPRAASGAGLASAGPALPGDPFLRGPSPGATRALLLASGGALLVYDAFILASVGVGIFSGANPDIVKVEATAGGRGIFRHLLVAALLVHLPLLVHAHFIHRLRATTVLALAVYLVHTLVFSFSKAGLVLVAFDFGLLAYFYQRALGRQVLSVRLAIGAAAVGAVPAVLVLGIVSARYGVSIVEAVMTRLVATGSGSYMYFTMDGSTAFRGMPLTERVPLVLDVLLSSLRLKDWAPMSYSARVGEYLTGVPLPGFGANPYPFVAGHFLAGWGGLAYCLALGLLVGLVRTRRSSFLTFFIGVQLVLSAVVDPGIAQSQIVALLICSPIAVGLWLVADAQGARLLVPLSASRAARAPFPAPRASRSSR